MCWLKTSFFEPEIDFNYLKWKVPRYVRIHNIPFSFFLHRTVSRRKWEYLEIKKVEEGRNTWQLPTRWDHWLFIIIIYQGPFVCVVRCNLDLSYLSGSKLTLSIIEKNWIYLLPDFLDLFEFMNTFHLCHQCVKEITGLSNSTFSTLF